MESFGSISVAVNPGSRWAPGTRGSPHRSWPRSRRHSPRTRTRSTAWSRSDQPASSPVPSRRAKVGIADGSEPAVGSVRAKQPIASPAAICGNHSCFCSSDPHLWIADMASEPCTETKVRRPESPASSSSAARPYSTAGGPGSRSRTDASRADRVRPVSGTISSGKSPLVPVGDVGPDLLVDEVADLLPEGEFVRTQQGMDRQDIGNVGNISLIAHASILRPPRMPDSGRAAAGWRCRK